MTAIYIPIISPLLEAHPIIYPSVFAQLQSASIHNPHYPHSKNEARFEIINLDWANNVHTHSRKAAISPRSPTVSYHLFFWKNKTAHFATSNFEQKSQFTIIPWNPALAEALTFYTNQSQPRKQGSYSSLRAQYDGYLYLNSIATPSGTTLKLTKWLRAASRSFAQLRAASNKRASTIDPFRTPSTSAICFHIKLDCARTAHTRG